MNQTTEERARLLLSLPARAENVAVVRHALTGLGERLGMDQAAIADMQTVVTEAAMNVVVHAYPGDADGPLEVEAFSEREGLTLVVRDRGEGIRPTPDIDRPSLRIGLTLIAALSESFEIRGGAGRGTEIRMHLALRGADATPAPAPEVEAAPEEAQVQVGPPDLVGPVLSRVVGALAARREITVDRLSDAMLLSDAIAAAAPQGFLDGHVELQVADGENGVVMRIGPMHEGSAERVRAGLELPEVGSLEGLADELRVETGAEGEFLVVAIDALK